MKSPPSTPEVLVTGATGFLGAAIVQQLRMRPCSVRTSGRRMSPPTDSPNYCAADVCDAALVSTLLQGVDVVIHAAGLAHQHRTTVSCDAEYFRINTAGAETVARAAAAAGCRRFVLVSSVAVYGNGWPPKSENDDCCPVSAYARSKFAAEQLITRIAAAANMELVILRMATLYGDNDPGNVGRLLRAIDRRRFFWIGRGDNRKSLVHVRDAANACVLAACRPVLPPHTTYNVSATPRTMNDIVSSLAAALRRQPPSLHLPARIPMTAAAVAGKIPGLAEPMRRVRITLEKWLSDESYDATLFRKSFGWIPTAALQDGLTQQVARYRQDQQRLAVHDSRTGGFEQPTRRSRAA